jgi:acetyl-CoA carboxylase biotin carboxyl carrier protein
VVVAESVRSEMAGTVWRVEVAPGDLVEPGSVLLVLESMKMEIPVAAETAGAVTAVRVAEGDAVGEGDLLATIG